VEWQLQARRPSLSPSSIIIVDIQKKDYHFKLFANQWAEHLGVLLCPACGALDYLKRHAHYRKHYYLEQIQILRVKCSSCGTTHAIIPSFSLPGTSGGTEKVEQYLMSRHEGVGRGTAGRLFQELRVSERYGLQLERMFARSVNQAKALFPHAGEPYLKGMEWVRSVVEDPSRPLYSLNCFCLQQRVNAVCFCRASILRFRISKAGGRFSHNLGTPKREGSPIYSP
jgi:hypothetical protein